MMRSRLRVPGFVCVVVISLVVLRSQSGAVPLDSDGTIRLGVRTYVNTRIGTESTDKYARPAVDANGQPRFTNDGELLIADKSRTFPVSSAGHMRQNRFFIEAELKHDLRKLLKRGVGPFALLNRLPFRIKDLSYGLTYRGEYDGIYDWGPSEYRTADDYSSGVFKTGENPIRADVGRPTCPPQAIPFSDETCRRQVQVEDARHNLRRNASHRSRLFQAYLDMSAGRFWFRFGRQILSWGETDSFRLLDNINPIDSSFGGFLIPLDERRVPLDMLRVQYRIGSMRRLFGIKWLNLSEAFIEMYGAIDNKVGFSPGTAEGSPWTLPNLGHPSSTTDRQIKTPGRNFRDIRGGGRFVWNMFDATFSLAHYYTYFDTPAIQVFTNNPNDLSDPTRAVFPFPLSTLATGHSAQTWLTAPQVQVSGGSTTFALPSLYTVVRSEFAYFKQEPRFSQSQLDPFIFSPVERQATGGKRTGDSINYALGFDINQYIRALNPHQTFFISTQFFYKHLVHAVKRKEISPGFTRAGILDGEVLPVPKREIQAPFTATQEFSATEPDLVRMPTDTFLHTLFIGTSYRSGTVNPSFTFFYDWGGALVYQPSITLIRDPFRFTVDYSIISAGALKGGSGVSLLRDRDNIQFRFEYVI